MTEVGELKGVVLAAGPGKRLRPMTHSVSKHMLPIAGKPVIQYGIEVLEKAGVKDIGVVVGYMRKPIMDFLGDGSRFGVKLTYIFQEEPRGIAHAIQCAKEYVGDDPFVVYLGDNLIKSSLERYIKIFLENKSDALVLLARVRDPQRFAVAEMYGKKVTRVIEKPKQPVSDLVVIGIYFFKNCIFDVIKDLKPSWRNELEIADAIQRLIDLGYNVKAEKIDGWWADSGRPEDLLESNCFILDEIKEVRKGVVEKDVQIQGRVAIMQNTVIKKGCKIRGPVYIGHNCEIGPDTFVGPYTSIEDSNTIVGGHIENSIIFEGNRICIEGEIKIIDSIIGRNSVIVSIPQSRPRGLKLVVGEDSYITI